MLYGEIISLISQRVNGGKETVDKRVFRSQIGTYLSAAVNYAITQDYFVGKKMGEGINTDFISTHYPTVSYDSVRELRYITLPKRVMPLPGNRGKWHVGAIAGNMAFDWTTFAARQHNSHYEGNFRSQVLAMPEEDKIYFINLPSSVTQVLFQGIMSIEDLSDEDKMPVPAGTEIQIIDLCVQFFTGQRQMPDDRKPDQIDN